MIYLLIDCANKGIFVDKVIRAHLRRVGCVLNLLIAKKHAGLMHRRAIQEAPCTIKSVLNP